MLTVVSQELPKFSHNERTGAFRSWLRKILVHRLQNYWRGRKRQPPAKGGSSLLEQLNQLEDDKSGLSRIWNEQHDRELIAKLIELTFVALVRSAPAPEPVNETDLGAVGDEQVHAEATVDVASGPTGGTRTATSSGSGRQTRAAKLDKSVEPSAGRPHSRSAPTASGFTPARAVRRSSAGSCRR